MVALAIVQKFSASYFLGQRIEQPTISSATFSEQNQFWRFYQWLQRQQVFTSINLFGNGWRVRKKTTMTRTIDVSRKILAGAAEYPPDTYGNCRQSLPAYNLPAFAGNYSCGTIYQRPSQILLHAPVLKYLLCPNM